MTQSEMKPGSLGELYDVLDRAFPAYRTRRGFLNVNELSLALGTTSQNMYKWFKKEKVPAKYVKPLLTLSKERMTLDKLLPFVI